MKLDVVLGLQWGDEGKGKIVDVLAGNYPVVARFQGGPNAGHSLHFEGKSFVLRSVPSGIFRKDAQNIVGNGVVLPGEQLCRYGNEVPAGEHFPKRAPGGGGRSGRGQGRRCIRKAQSLYGLPLVLLGRQLRRDEQQRIIRGNILIFIGGTA